MRGRLSEGLDELEFKTVKVHFIYPFPPAETVEYYRTYYGPIKRAFEALPEEKQQALHAELEALWAQNNQASDGTTFVESEYLEVVATRASPD